MFSFVKELDPQALRLARHLNDNQARLSGRYRGLRFLVVWLDGDAKRLAQWSRDHKLGDLSLGVIAGDDPSLAPWKINPRAASTTVLINRRMPLGNLVNLMSGEFGQLELQMAEQFKKYRRCQRD